MENFSTQTISVKSTKNNKLNNKTSKIPESVIVQSNYIPLFNEDNISILVDANNTIVSKSYLIRYKDMDGYVINLEEDSVSVKELCLRSFPYFDYYDAFINPITKLFTFLGLDIPDIVIDVIFSKSSKYLESVDSSKIKNEILAKIPLCYLIKTNRYDLIERLGNLIRFQIEDIRGLDFSKLSKESINTIVRNIMCDSSSPFIYGLDESLIRDNKELQISILTNETISVNKISLLFDHKDENILYLLKARLYFENRANSLDAKIKLAKRWNMFFSIFSGEDINYSLFDVLDRPTKKQALFFLSNKNVLSSFVKSLGLNSDNENDVLFAKSLIIDSDCVFSENTCEINEKLKSEALTYLVRNKRWDDISNFRSAMNMIKFKNSELIDLLGTKYCSEIRFWSGFNSIFELLTDSDFVSLCESNKCLMDILNGHTALRERYTKIVKIKNGIDLDI